MVGELRERGAASPPGRGSGGQGAAGCGARGAAGCPESPCAFGEKGATG